MSTTDGTEIGSSTFNTAGFMAYDSKLIN